MIRGTPECENKLFLNYVSLYYRLEVKAGTINVGELEVDQKDDH